MNNSVVINKEKRLSSMTRFWLCVLATVGIGLTISYCSGIFDRTVNTAGLPFAIPKWVQIATPPALYFLMSGALYLILEQNVYTYDGRTVRGWTWAFWLTLFISTSITPYFIYYGMPIAAYIMSSITAALAIGTAILSYRQTVGGGAVMTIFATVATLVMVYLGYWAFA